MLNAVPHAMEVRFVGFIEMEMPVTCNGPLNVAVGEWAGEADATTVGVELSVGVGVEALLLEPKHALTLNAIKHIQSIISIKRLYILTSSLEGLHTPQLMRKIVSRDDSLPSV
jgi:hypothetical protein